MLATERLGPDELRSRHAGMPSRARPGQHRPPPLSTPPSVPAHQQRHKGRRRERTTRGKGEPRKRRGAEGWAAAASPRAPGPVGLPRHTGRGLTQMSCFSPIGKFEYKSTISGVLYMGVVFLVIWRGERVRGNGTGPSQLLWQSRAAGPGAGQVAWPGWSHEALHGGPGAC